MEEKDGIARLCGGTFFSLLLRARKQRTATRNGDLNSTDGLAQTDMLRDLIRVFYRNYVEPAKGNSFKQNVSQYRTCMINSNTYLPFDRSEIVKEFKNKLINNDKELLMLMDRFVEKYIDTSYAVNDLISTLVNVIEADDMIPSDAEFYISVFSEPIKKTELLKKEICLPAFLLGVWGYIITEIADNSRGKDTIIMWSDKDSSGKKIKLKTGILVGKKREFKYEPYYNYRNDNRYTNEAEIQYDDIDIISDFRNYLNHIKDKYGIMKTLLYSDQGKPFRDFYVCNNLYKKERMHGESAYRHKAHIENFDVDQVYGKYGFLIITGTGGIGKSMMMRHLLLDTVDKYERLHMVPVYITLKDYAETSNDLFDYIYNKIKNIENEISESAFVQLLVAGRCLLLFDGLDEIKTEYRENFEKELEIFTDKYLDNIYIISSRPYSQFVSFSRFKIFELDSFTKKQALELIDKLDFRSDEPRIKKKFRQELDRTLYDSHRDFTANPLLLTIMLMTYEQFAEIPSKMHIFYQEAYIALAQKHDASKGAYKRRFATSLSADRFASYFEEFCARTYTDEKFELSVQEMTLYFDSLKERKRYNSEKEIIVTDFIEDLCDNVCLMYYENANYQFTHRSFQEYFCASYFSKQKDRLLWTVGQFFEKKKHRMSTDKTFAMLYDMIPDKVEEYIFIPYIENLLKKCDGGRGYWEFLCEIYPTICYAYGSVDDRGVGVNNPESFLYVFIEYTYAFAQEIDYLELEFYEDFVEQEYATIFDEDEEMDIVDIESLSKKYIEINGKPKPSGYALRFSVEKVLQEKENYSDLIKQLDDDSFPMKREYKSLRGLLDQLKERQKESGIDLFKLF